MFFSLLSPAAFLFIFFILYWYVFRTATQRVVVLLVANFLAIAAFDIRFCIPYLVLSALAYSCGLLILMQKSFKCVSLQLWVAHTHAEKFLMEKSPAHCGYLVADTFLLSF
ncbi:hypothetical protein KEB26_05290 [Treponema pallidum]|nr:hypothetical protein KEB26_05290 [Treponema pallidum]